MNFAILGIPSGLLCLLFAIGAEGPLAVFFVVVGLLGLVAGYFALRDPYY